MTPAVPERAAFGLRDSLAAEKYERKYREFRKFYPSLKGLQKGWKRPYINNKKVVKKLLTFCGPYSIVSIVPVNGTQKHRNATVAQLVEYDLAKVGVAGSNPVCRSEKST